MGSEAGGLREDATSIVTSPALALFREGVLEWLLPMAVVQGATFPSLESFCKQLGDLFDLIGLFYEIAREGRVYLDVPVKKGVLDPRPGSSRSRLDGCGDPLFPVVLT